nr:MAG: hypothetical protein EDM05_29155 [Leptolyngbya sp. IPPAS B-1204]
MVFAEVSLASDHATVSLASPLSPLSFPSSLSAPIQAGLNQPQSHSLAGSDLSRGSLRGRSLSGNRQNNLLLGRAGADIVRGRAGDDVLKGFGGNDQLFGELGDDRLLGGTGNDSLSGGLGRNTLNGEAGQDQLLGGKDADQLVGGSGDDRLNGQGGRDKLTGGTGRDRFVLAVGAAQLRNAAEITDFRDGEDFLELTTLKFEDLVILQGTGQQAGNTLIQNKQTGEYLAILKNIQSSQIDIRDFWNMMPTPVAPAANPMPSPMPSPSPVPPPSPSSPLVPTIPAIGSFQSTTVKFLPNDSETTIAATSAARLQLGSQTIYIGTQQVTSDNQNPILASFDAKNPSNNWVRTDYEVTGTDGRGYGLFWSGSQLYAVFSVDGTQGTPAEDFRRVSGDATQSWLRSYGAGGGAKVAVLTRINPATGELTDAVYLSSILSSGKSNSLEVKGLSLNAAGNLVVTADSYFAPRRPDGKAMTQTAPGSSPFDYTLEITPDLTTVISTSAVGWS